MDQFAKAVDNAVGMAIVYGQANPAAIQARQALLAEYRKLEKQRDHWRRELDELQSDLAAGQLKSAATETVEQEQHKRLPARRRCVVCRGKIDATVEGVVASWGDEGDSPMIDMPDGWFDTLPFGTRVLVTVLPTDAVTAPSIAIQRGAGAE